MNKPLPRSAFGKKFDENFERIFAVKCSECGKPFKGKLCDECSQAYKDATTELRCSMDFHERCDPNKWCHRLDCNDDKEK